MSNLKDHILQMAKDDVNILEVIIMLAERIDKLEERPQFELSQSLPGTGPLIGSESDNLQGDLFNGS